MPIDKKFKAGSIVYFEGDKADSIYILKSGKIRLTFFSPDVGAEESQELRPGEFFGLRAVLGHFNREETAQVVNDSIVLQLNHDEFESLATKSIDMTIKMLKVFSGNLRKYGKKVTNILSSKEGTEKQPSIELFKLGDYYLGEKRFNHAEYTYHKYLHHYPSGILVQQAKERISFARRKISKGFPEIKFNLLIENEHATEPSEDELADFGMELMDMDTDTDSDNKQEDVETNIIDKDYYEALNHISNEKFSAAHSLLQKIINLPEFADEEKEQKEKIVYEFNFCQFKLKRYENVISGFTTFIKSFPKSDKLKSALYYIGMSYKHSDENDKAKGFLKKVINMEPKEDELYFSAKKELENL